MGFILCILAIKRAWIKGFGPERDRVSRSMYFSILNTIQSAFPCFPTDPYFLTLKFSAGWHAFLCIVSCVLCYFVYSQLLHGILLAINYFFTIFVGYTWFKCSKVLRVLDPHGPMIPYLKAGLSGRRAVLLYSVYLAILVTLFPAVCP